MFWGLTGDDKIFGGSTQGTANGDDVLLLMTGELSELANDTLKSGDSDDADAQDDIELAFEVTEYLSSYNKK